MDSCKEASLPGILDIVPTLPIEEQRAALAWLRQAVAELGCLPDVETLVSENFVEFLPCCQTTHSLN